MKNFLSITDLSKAELLETLTLAEKLKKGVRNDTLKNKEVALVFEKPSLRTKASFEVGIRELGGAVSFFGAAEIGKLGERESVADFARVLSGYYDAIVARVFDHEKLEEFTKYASVPVVNALSDREHPCQILADLLTIQEKLGKLDGLKIVFLGDGNNVAQSLALAARILGLEFVLAGPQKYWLTSNSGIDSGEFQQTEELQTALKNADVVVTDTWTSMGAEAESETREKIFAPFQLNADTLKLARPNAIVLHCLPTHRGQEITDDVIDGPHSAVFLEAANRLPAQKAVLVKLAREWNKE